MGTLRGSSVVAAIVLVGCATARAGATTTTTSTATSTPTATATATSTSTSTATATATPAATATTTPTATPAATATTTPTATPAATPTAEQLFTEGVTLEASGDVRAAAAAFERAYEADPTLAQAGVNAGILREREGDLAAARALYARVLDATPAFGPAARNLVRLAIRAGDLRGAEREARERLARAPGSAALRNALVDVLLAAGRLDEAERESRRALEIDGRDVAAVVNLATVYLRQERNELARTALENARAIAAGDPSIWNRLGLLELAEGNRAQALDAFRTAASLAPEYAEARANYGALLADADDFVGATAELEAAVRYAPWSAAAWLGLGNACRGAGRFDDAESAYRKALALDPSLVEAVFNLAVLYLDGEKPDMPALARLERALELLATFERDGGRDARLGEHRRDAERAIEREKKRLAREERDRLRREADASTARKGAERGDK